MHAHQVWWAWPIQFWRFSSFLFFFKTAKFSFRIINCNVIYSVPCLPTNTKIPYHLNTNNIHVQVEVKTTYRDYFLYTCTIFNSQWICVHVHIQ